MPGDAETQIEANAVGNTTVMAEYKESELYLNYAVSERIAQMIRETSHSLHMVGYKFVPDCDEGRDIFLALHQLGIQCMREQRQVDIVITIDCRKGPAAAFYKASDMSGLDWLSSFKKLYPNLHLNVKKITHFGRNTIHSKAVVADNLVMLKSGEGSAFNSRNGSQREDGILLSSLPLANQIKGIIAQHVAETHAEGVTSQSFDAVTLPEPIDMPDPYSIDENIATLDEMTFEAFNRLKRNIYFLAHLDSSDFNPERKYQDLKTIQQDCKKDIALLKKQSQRKLLQALYHNNQDALFARAQWIKMILQVERESVPISSNITHTIQSEWETNQDHKKIHLALKKYQEHVNAALSGISVTPLRITESTINHVLSRLSMAYQQTTIDDTLTLLSESIVALQEDGLRSISFLKDNQEPEPLDQPPVEILSENHYQQTCQELKNFVTRLSNVNDINNAQQAVLFLAFEAIWHRLTMAFNQMKQTSQYATKVDYLLSQKSSNETKSKYAILFDFLTLCGEDPKKTYTAEYDQLYEKIQSYNQIVYKKVTHQSEMLYQTASFSPSDSHSSYKKAFIQKIDVLNSEDTVNIAVSNLNDPDIIAALADACNRGVIVRIAMGKYMNHFFESMPGGGGSNSKAMANLLKKVNDDKKKNLQVRWLVFTEDNQQSIGSTKCQKGTHRKYVSMHKKNTDKKQEEYSCFMGSSPLDRQAHFHSEELDIILNEPKQIKKADSELFDQEYNSGIDMHFCLAIDSLKKSGFPHYAQLQYHRYMSEIDISGKDSKKNHREMIYQELFDFISTHESSDAVTNNRKYLKNIEKTKNYLSYVYSPKKEMTIDKNKGQDAIQECLIKLALSLDQYKQGKTWSNKKYLRLLDELKKEKSVDAIVKKVTQRIQEQSGYLGRFHKNSFAICLAKNHFFPTSTVPINEQNKVSIKSADRCTLWHTLNPKRTKSPLIINKPPARITH